MIHGAVSLIRIGAPASRRARIHSVSTHNVSGELFKLMRDKGGVDVIGG
jgi:hypothetical protein